MLRLNIPQRSARETFTICISRVRNAGLRRRLFSIEDTIAASSDAFSIAAAAQTLHEIARQDNVNQIVTCEEMEAVYVQRMAKKGAPGRAIYEELISTPPHARCPICAQRSVTTLDHHLPKAHYPALAVSPINLVPSCSDCNKLKLAGFPLNANEVTLHPYFDNVDGHRWLFGEVIQSQPAAIRFFARPPDDLNAILAERLTNHFAVFGLARLYATEAAEELLNVRHHLTQLYDAGGVNAVRLHLEEEAASRLHARLNSWRTATYSAWAETDWFCDGGFLPSG